MHTFLYSRYFRGGYACDPGVFTFRNAALRVKWVYEIVKSAYRPYRSGYVLPEFAAFDERTIWESKISSQLEQVVPEISWKKKTGR